MGESEKVLKVLSALAHPVRQRILELVAHRALSSSELAKQFECSWPAVSKHLRVLQDASLIGRYDFEDDGHYRYTKAHEGFTALQEWLRRYG